MAGGEGLLGVQRAFQVAGADTTIATVWKVDDVATQRIMKKFYTGYLLEEKSPVDALRDAQLWALRHPDEVLDDNRLPRGEVEQLESLPEVEPSDERLPPKFWAGFVLSGQWR